jgi:drug/metabolite transporter (DMT)-like permease
VLPAVLALLAAAGYGAADFLGGLKSKALSAFAVIAVSQGATLLGVALVTGVSGVSMPEVRYLLFGAFAGLAGAVGIVALYRGLAVGAMGIVAPITATGVAIPVVVGVLRGERPGAVQVAGLVLALAGVVLASFEVSGERSGRRGAVAAGVGYALVGAVGVGLFFTALDAASEGGVLWALLMQRAVLVALVAAVAGARRTSLRIPRRDLLAVLAVGVLDIGANAAFAYASTRGLLSLVAVLGSLYPVVTILLARVILGEQIDGLQRVGVVVALTGIICITAG